MKKLTILCLCLLLLTGCEALRRIYALESAPVTAAPVEITLPPEAILTPVPAATLPPQPTDEPTAAPTAEPEPEPTAEPTPEPTVEPTPEPTAEPTAEPEPEPTATLSTQSCAGACFSFDAPADWRRKDIQNGIVLFPDAGDTRHTFLFYQEADNSLGLSEAAVDVALFLSPQTAITDLVTKALTNSGLTDFTLAPVSVKKTKLNGSTCYRGASTVTLSGEVFDFEGYVFFRGDRMVLLIWAGDGARYAQELAAVYRSFHSLP